jgi:hypothetical protein
METRSRLPSWRILFLDAAKNALQPRAQLARVERLGDVVVGADFEARHAVDHVARAGDHDDAELVALAQVARERQAVLARQADVEQHHRRRRALELRAHRGAARGERDLVAVLAEILRQHLPDRRVVVDHQNARRCHRRQVYKPETNCFPPEITSIRAPPTLLSSQCN